MSRKRVIKLMAVIALLMTFVVAGTIYLSHANSPSAIDTATTWARVAPLPPSARNVDVDVKSSMFSREFIITFNAPPAVIQKWIAASPGLTSASLSTTGSVTTYAITPGGGAQFAEVKVDSRAHQVIIRTYWS